MNRSARTGFAILGCEESIAAPRGPVGGGQPFHSRRLPCRTPAPILLQAPADENNIGTSQVQSIGEAAMFFTFPEDAHWNANTETLEFGVEIGEYQGIVRVPRQVFRR